MTTSSLIQLALFGTPGAGKSTTSKIIEDYCTGAGVSFIRIKLADPLYEAQSAIYSIAGKQLSDFYQQDGELLNFLGSYLRKLNPNVLLDRFSNNLTSAIEKLDLSGSPTRLVVCDDMRRPDADFLRSMNFKLIRITADVQVCDLRRGERGDRSLGSASHATEQGLDEIVPDHLIPNETSIEDLRVRVTALMEELCNDSNRERNT